MATAGKGIAKIQREIGAPAEMNPPMRSRTAVRSSGSNFATAPGRTDRGSTTELHVLRWVGLDRGQ